MKKFKAELWKLEVVNSAMDMIHGIKHTITEIYFPLVKIACNVVNNELHCFCVLDGRYKDAKKICSFNLEDPTIIDKIEIWLNEKEHLKDEIKLLIDQHKK